MMKAIMFWILWKVSLMITRKFWVRWMYKPIVSLTCGAQKPLILVYCYYDKSHNVWIPWKFSLMITRKLWVRRAYKPIVSLTCGTQKPLILVYCYYDESHNVLDTMEVFPNDNEKIMGEMGV